MFGLPHHAHENRACLPGFAWQNLPKLTNIPRFLIKLIAHIVYYFWKNCVLRKLKLFRHRRTSPLQQNICVRGHIFLSSLLSNDCTFERKMTRITDRIKLATLTYLQFKARGTVKSTTTPCTVNENRTNNNERLGSGKWKRNEYRPQSSHLKLNPIWLTRSRIIRSKSSCICRKRLRVSQMVRNF